MSDLAAAVKLAREVQQWPDPSVAVKTLADAVLSMANEIRILKTSAKELVDAAEARVKELEEDIKDRGRERNLRD